MNLSSSPKRQATRFSDRVLPVECGRTMQESDARSDALCRRLSFHRQVRLRRRAESRDRSIRAAQSSYDMRLRAEPEGSAGLRFRARGPLESHQLEQVAATTDYSVLITSLVIMPDTVAL